MTDKSKEVGHRIRKLRESKDLNQQYMADKLKLTAGAYAKIERGETDPSISRLFEIAGILKVDIVNLIKDGRQSISIDVQQQVSVIAKDVEELKKQMAAQYKASTKKK